MASLQLIDQIDYMLKEQARSENYIIWEKKMTLNSISLKLEEKLKRRRKVKRKRRIE